MLSQWGRMDYVGKMLLISTLSILLLAAFISAEPDRKAHNNDDFRTQPGHKAPKKGDFNGRLYCPSKYVCKSKRTEIERWECLGRM